MVPKVLDKLEYWAEPNLSKLIGIKEKSCTWVKKKSTSQVHYERSLARAEKKSGGFSGLKT